MRCHNVEFRSKVGKIITNLHKVFFLTCSGAVVCHDFQKLKYTNMSFIKPQNFDTPDMMLSVLRYSAVFFVFVTLNNQLRIQEQRVQR